MGKVYLSRMEVLILYSMLSLNLICCSSTGQNNVHYLDKLRGHWYTVNSDSVYEEVIFVDSALLGIDFGPGLFFRNIKVKEDSIEFYSEGLLLNSVKVEFKDSLMTAFNGLDKTTYFRIKGIPYSDKETASLFSGNSDSIKKFRLEFYARENEWRSKEK